MSTGLTYDDLKGFIDQIGWVYPNSHQKTATVAVKVVGINFAYGKWLLRVAPLAGTGSWQVAFEGVEFQNDGEIEP